jgi:ABC-type lipoprotein export system ATPase subunit
VSRRGRTGGPETLGHPAATAPAPGPAIALRGAGYDVDGVTLLDGVDLDLAAGELLAVVGPNGAGKSTLLGLLAGDLRPTRGTVAYGGVPAADLPVAALARRRAVLLQEHRLSFPFSVVDVVRMGRAPWRATDADDADDAVVAGALAAGDVRHLADRRFPTLSGGEKARTAYARARAQDTPVLLLDEPTSPAPGTPSSPCCTTSASPPPTPTASCCSAAAGSARRGRPPTCSAPTCWARCTGTAWRCSCTRAPAT